MDRTFIDKLGALIRRLTSETPAMRVPSATECRFCYIAREDCPDRIEGKEGTEGGTADF